MADRLLVAIRNADEDGLTGTVGTSIKDTNRALARLEAAGLVVRVQVKTAGVGP